MNDSERTDRVMVAVFGLVAAGLLLAASGGVYSARVQAHCLRLGWPGAHLSWSFEGYCSARIDNTDVVVPWRDARPR